MAGTDGACATPTGWYAAVGTRLHPELHHRAKPGMHPAPAAPLASHSWQPSPNFCWRAADDDHPGLRFEDQSWSWQEVVDESAARASLIGSFVEDGAEGEPLDDQLHVGVLLGNVPEYVFWLGAAALAGAVVVGINPTRRGDALAGDIVRTDCSLLVTDGEGRGPARGPRLRRPARPRPADRHAGVRSGSSQRTRGPTRPKIVDESRPTAEDLYLLLFTSGTTGDPKAVRCTQGRLASIAVRSADAYGFERGDVAYCAMPLFHGNALMVLWGPTLVVGGTVALARRFSASGFGRDLRRYGTTTFTYVGQGAGLRARDAGRAATTRQRRSVGASGPRRRSPTTPPSSERFGCVLTEGYGSSEGGLAISWTPDTPTGSLGRSSDDVAVVDPETMAECPPARFDAGGGTAQRGRSGR